MTNDIDKKNVIIKICVSENEALFIKNYLKDFNENLREYDSNLKTFREKSLSEFLREIILNHLLKIDCVDNNIEKKLNQILKFSKRNLSLSFKNTEKLYGDNEAKNIIVSIKNNEIND